jgi:hypothetical protein
MARTVSAIRITDAGGVPADQMWRRLPLRLDVAGMSGGRTIERTCTGLRVSETRVLTGAHCFRDLESGDGRIRVEGTDGEPDACANTFTLADVQSHPIRDVALVGASGLSVGDVAALSGVLPEAGSALVLAGYGLTERLTTGELRAISATVVSADADRIVVQGIGGGACLGDSGGPLLLPGASVSVGVLWRGSATCEGRDEYVPTPTLADWLTAIEPSIVFERR